jgi:hypothetical protein
MTANTDFAQLATRQAERLNAVAERENLKTVHHHFFLHHFSVSHVERHGHGYRVNLLFWPRRYPTSRWNFALLCGQAALEKRVAKVGYELRGYSDKSDDMHLIVSESAGKVQK